MKKIAAMLAFAGVLVSANANARDYSTLQTFQPGEAKITALSIKTGHSFVGVEGTGNLQCVLFLLDQSQGYMVQDFREGSCHFEVYLRKSVVALLIIQNTDGEEHTYQVLGVH